MTYYIERQVTGELDDVDDALREALSADGFGVLTEIDVAATMKAKLGVDDHREYRILGACNPEIAHQALDAETNLGALLPCNVVLYEADAPGEVVIAAVDPEAMLSIVDNPALDSFAGEVRDRIECCLDEVAG